MYGVTAYSAQQREREVAIRIAVGFLAIWRPATRAASKNPTSALKQI